MSKHETQAIVKLIKADIRATAKRLSAIYNVSYAHQCKAYTETIKEIFKTDKLTATRYVARLIRDAQRLGVNLYRKGLR